MLKKLLSKKKVTNVGVAELKITAILIVNTALGVTGLVTYTFADMEVVLEATAVLFCIGSEGSNCYQGTDRLNIISITLPATFILLSLLPVVAILFTCDVHSLKKMARDAWIQKCKSNSKK